MESITAPVASLRSSGAEGKVGSTTVALESVESTAYPQLSREVVFAVEWVADLETMVGDMIH